jgi:ATP-dependent helicase HrpB
MVGVIPPDLPIHAALPDLLAHLAETANVVLVALPGAGKTTTVPLALLDQPWCAGKRILVLAPRRLAARAAASRMAALLGEAVGQTVGYQVRLDKNISKQTRIEVITEGILTRRMQDDPALDDVAAIVFDEVHERNLEADLGLALALDSQAALREDLRLIAMSATLDGGRFSELMGGAPIVESAGKLYPIDTFYVGRKADIALEIQAAQTALLALKQGEGDILVFLPGLADIKRAQDFLAAKNLGSKCLVVPLHGSLSPAEQDQALAPAPAGARKIILSTAIAQTSLTIEGVRIVVDGGLSRRPRYEPGSGLTRLESVRCSRAASDQRRGRAGRTSPGQCYRLWDEAQMGAFPAFDRPEILEADFAPLVLTLAGFDITDPGVLSWLDPPPKAAWQEAVKLLIDLEALDNAPNQAPRLTAHGRSLSEFGLPPRLAHMIVKAGELGFGATAAFVAGLLSEKGLGGTQTDISARLISFQHDHSPRATKARAQAQNWARQIGAREPVEPEEAGRALALAYPERVAKARDRQGGFVMANGRGGELDPRKALAGADYLAIGALMGQAAHARIGEAARLTKADIEGLFASLIETRVHTQFDRPSGTLRTRQQRRFGALVLDEAPCQLSPEAYKAGLLDAVKSHGLSILNWSPRAIAFQDRLVWLAKQDPQTWPQLTQDALMAQLDDWLAPALFGIKALGDVDVGDALETYLGWSQLQAIGKAAPTRFETPLQTSHMIDYAAEQGPTVAVRVQELFGLRTHPMLAGGKVALVFQLLSPAQRPVAVTANLPAFWAGGWQDVCKDMKARYPRHIWPQDPANAQPTARAKPRS